MVNYILSFCRITAASRIFSRNFYLPLLKPLTPKDALRTFRITGKWLLGAKGQHYIPVLLNHTKKRSKNSKNYGKLKHKPTEGYTYIIPVLDPENENHKLLLDVLKEHDNTEGFFVYTVDDKKCNIILTAPMELAIRGGEIIDVMVSQRNDKILLKLANFKKMGIDCEPFLDEDAVLNKGEGATTVDEEKCHHHGKFTMSIAKIFEDKEREAEEWELELQKIINRKRKNRLERTKAFKEMLKIAIKNLDWNQFEMDAKKVIDQINEPIVEHQIDMKVYDLEKTKKANEIIKLCGLDILPSLSEIPDVVNAMSTAHLDEITAEIEEEDEDGEIVKVKRTLSGVKVKLPSGKEVFIVGQMVKTEEGDVFVPGQTIETEFGLEYSPGFTVNVDNEITLVKGLIMGENKNENEQKPMFLPTESTITADGQLTFATNKEERIKYKPKKKKNRLMDNVLMMGDDTLQDEENRDEVEIEIEFEQNDLENNEDMEYVHPSMQELEDIILTVMMDEDAIEESSLEENTNEAEDNSLEENSINSVEKLEFEELLKELLDDGMDDLINNIEDKKATLQQKLEELRKLKLQQNNTNTFASIESCLDISKCLTENQEDQLKIGETLLVLIRKISNFRDRHAIYEENVDIPGENEQNDKLFIALKRALFEANEAFKKRPKDQLRALKKIGDELIQQNITESDFGEFSKTPMDRNELAQELIKQLTKTNSKTLIFRAMLQESDLSIVANKICEILAETGSYLPTAFSKLAKNNPNFTQEILDELKNKSYRLKNENSILEAVKTTIVAETLKYCENTFNKINDSLDSDLIHEFLVESKSLAIALGLYDVNNNIEEMLKDPDVDLTACSVQTQNLLKKSCLLRKLSGKDIYTRRTIQKLLDNPEKMRNDSILRDLVKEVAVLTSQASPLKNSKDLPLQHLKSQNMLALEYYLAQRITTELPVMIYKKEFQAIVPKDSSKAVLSGRVPYLILDESGMSKFKPKHMLSALRSDDIAKKVDRERSQSPFFVPSRSASPQVEAKGKTLLKAGRMVA